MRRGWSYFLETPLASAHFEVNSQESHSTGQTALKATPFTAEFRETLIFAIGLIATLSLSISINLNSEVWSQGLKLLLVPPTHLAAIITLYYGLARLTPLAFDLSEIHSKVFKFLYYFFLFFMVFSLATLFMTLFVYDAAYNYQFTENPTRILGVNGFYSLVSAIIMQQYNNLKERKLKFDDDRGEQFILVIIAIIFGPGLISIMSQNVYWPNSLKIQLSVVAYVSLLYLFFSIYDYLVGNSIKAIIGRRPNPSIPIEFVKFYLTFLSAAFCMYTFVYIPILHYQTPKNYVVIIVTTCLYSFLAAAIFYRFRQLKDIALRSKVAQAEAQYTLLESQMQPHFLFNSLNVLSELVYVDPDLANSMAQKMADLYREVLNNSKNNFSNLESEISILKKYIEIQRIRFGDRIRFSTDVSPAFMSLQIPSLMLQTLVENAIKHGISPKQEGGEINLSVDKQGNMFEVCISNTGALYKGHTESKRSTGLQNTKNRLELAYGSKNSFQIYSDDKRTYVKFLITGRTS